MLNNISTKDKILYGVFLFLLIGVGYLYGYPYLEEFMYEDNSLSFEETVSSNDKKNKEIKLEIPSNNKKEEFYNNKNNENKVTEKVVINSIKKVESKEDNIRENKIEHNDFMDLSKIEKEVSNDITYNKLFQYRNEIELYKMKTEVLKEQVLFEMEQDKLAKIIEERKNKKIKQETVIENKEQDFEMKKLLEMINHQKEEINNIKNQGQMSFPLVTDPNMTHNPSASKNNQKNMYGINVLSIQRIVGGKYFAIMTIDGERKKVSIGTKIKNDTVRNIVKNAVIMVSGKKYMI